MHNGGVLCKVDIPRFGSVGCQCTSYLSSHSNSVYSPSSVVRSVPRTWYCHLVITGMIRYVLLGVAERQLTLLHHIIHIIISSTITARLKIEIEIP